MASRKVPVVVVAPGNGPEGSSPALFTVNGLGRVSVSVAVSLSGLGSDGAKTVAVLTRLPVSKHQSTVPVTVKMTELPAAILTVAARPLPEPVAPLLTESLPVVLDVQVTPVR